jgi:parvulin-like peptidyl-prolyl isomerase
MRRTALMLGPLFLLGTLAGCGNFRDLFSAHADLVAQAGGQQLTPQRLSQILAGGKAMRANRDAASFISNIWVDYALFANAVAEGKLPLDSTSMAQAMWPEVAELRGAHWHDTLTARRSKLSPNAADSTYDSNKIRVLQHILFRVAPNAKPDEKSAARKKADATLARIKHGADFSRVASEVSDDPGSKRDGGFLPPSPKGRYVPIFDSVGWALAPGAMSGVVETQFGYHIIKRPDQNGVRDRINAYLTQSAGARLDSIYMDSLALISKIKISSGAAATMRNAAENPEDARKSKKTLTSFKGGELTVGEYMRWLRALPPQYAGQLKSADDSMLTNFAKILTQNLLLLRQADSAKIGLTPAEWNGLVATYHNQVDSLRADMGLDTAALWDSSAATADRDKVAALKVDQYFDRLVSGKSRLRPMPSALATLLRDHASYKIYDAGLNRAVELAESERSRADSARAKAGPMQPAPGPAPIPGMTPPPSGGAPNQAPAPKGTPQPQSQPSQPRVERGDTATPKR